MLLETLFLLPHLFCDVEFELIELISLHQTVNWDFNSWNRNAAWVSEKDEYPSYWVLINPFWIGLRFVRYIFVRYRFARYRYHPQ